MKTGKILKVASFVLLLGLTVYAVFSFFGIGRSPEIVLAKEINEARTVEGQGWVFRSETVLREDSSCLVSAKLTDGSQVVAGDTVAACYSVEESERVETQKKLDALETAVSLVKAGIQTQDTTAAQNYRGANRTLEQLQEAIGQGDWERAQQLEQALQIQMERYSCLSGNEEALQTRLDSLQAQRIAVIGGRSETEAAAPVDGIWYGKDSVDGLEQVFSADALNGLTLDSLQELRNLPAVQTRTVLGKIVTGQTWYLAVCLESLPVSALTVGDSCSLRFSNETLSMTLERLEAGEGDTPSLAIFSSTEPMGLSGKREQSVTLILEAFSGFYIPNRAVVWKNGVSGVYILNGKTAEFRRVRYRYSTDGYYIGDTKNDGNSDERYLLVNDRILLDGEKLTEGKRYR